MTSLTDKTAMLESFKDWAATYIPGGEKSEDQAFGWLEINEAA
ncbi:hypothetical protein [Hydrogenophaga sp.]|nr:hypothetical protein [Hydrogenophaga sp.]MDP3885837.1 hypothetical protein [Hydrogenophaga sp.]